MRALSTNKVFVSAQRAGNSAEQNDVAHAKALDILRREGLSYRVMTGVWKGVQERSIMLEASDVRTHEAHVEAALSLARLFTQDAVLEVAHDGHAVMHDTLNGSGTSVLGTFREASREEALTLDGYTFDNESNRYFVVA